MIAMSPSLWWGGSILVASYADAIAGTTKTQRMFVTSGGLEGDIDRPTQRFSRLLDSLKPAHTAFGHQRYPEDSHNMTPASGLVDRLRFVHEPVSVAKLAHLDARTRHRLGGRDQRVHRIEAPLRNRRSLAWPRSAIPRDGHQPNGLRGASVPKNPALAVWFFRQNVEVYPESANVYDSLGDGLLAMGDTTSAITRFGARSRSRRAPVTVYSRKVRRSSRRSRKVGRQNLGATDSDPADQRARAAHWSCAHLSLWAARCQQPAPTTTSRLRKRARWKSPEL